MRVACLIATLSIAACTALAAPRETVTFTNVPSDGLLNEPVNAVRTSMFTGGYTLGRVDFSGTLTSLQGRTWRTDSRVLVTAPGGHAATIQPFTTGSTYTTLNFTGSIFMPVGTDLGEWSFRFYEAFDDAAGQTDAQMTITITLTDDPPVAPTASNIGVISAPGPTVTPAAIPAAGYSWYRFRLDREVRADLGRFLDIDTANSSLPFSSPDRYLDDTELVLFNSSGLVVASDDDSGNGFLSQLSFGAGTRPGLGDGLPYAGQNGALPAGEYFIAAGAYNLTPTGDYWALTATGPRAGTVGMRFSSNLAPGVDCAAVTGHPTEVTAFPGQTVLLSISATGTGPLGYQWVRAGVDLVEDGRITGCLTPVLSITNVDGTDMGGYACRVSNSCGATLSQSARVAVACQSDFNGDGAFGQDDDIEAFFLCLGGACCETCASSDFNGDGASGQDDDIESFFLVLGGGACV